MILERTICKICDCKPLCKYLEQCADAEWFECEHIRDLVIDILEKNLDKKEEEEK